ncbi:MAG: hypothetical protein HQL08_09510 [Nitrospirae bacterium]|nr:hypothetical protein [Nitrospirota bacterium]
MGKIAIILFILFYFPPAVVSADLEFMLQPVMVSRDFSLLNKFVNEHAEEKGADGLISFYRSLTPGMSHKAVSLLWHKYSSSGFAGGSEIDANSKESVDYMIMKCGDSSVYLFFKDDKLYGWSKPSWVKVNGKLLKD